MKKMMTMIMITAMIMIICRDDNGNEGDDWYHDYDQDANDDESECFCDEDDNYDYPYDD